MIDANSQRASPPTPLASGGASAVKYGGEPVDPNLKSAIHLGNRSLLSLDPRHVLTTDWVKSKNLIPSRRAAV